LFAQCKEESPVETPKEKQLCGDFFPLKLGNWWKYDYSYSVVYGIDSEWNDGTKTWEIVDAVVRDSSFYTVREIFSGRRVTKTYNRTPPPQYLWDTTYVPGDTSYIVLCEDFYHKVEIVNQTPTAYRKYLVISMPRYNPLSAGDTLWGKVPGYWSTTIKYVNNIGLYYYWWFSAGNHSYGETYALKEYRLTSDQPTSK
jgi:hypothetical protein